MGHFGRFYGQIRPVQIHQNVTLSPLTPTEPRKHSPKHFQVNYDLLKPFDVD